MSPSFSASAVVRSQSATRRRWWGPEVQCAVGTYTGDGAASLAVTGLGFQPDLVILKGRAATATVWRSSSMAGDTSAYFNNAANAANLIESLDADGFTVGSHADVNVSARIYDFQAFRITGGDDLAVGTYTGDLSDPTEISAGFLPDIVSV